MGSVFKKSRASIHFFNYLSIYTDRYMNTIKNEYWLGFERKKIFTIGYLTVWIRSKK